MSDIISSRNKRSSFSLWQLLIIITFIALGIALRSAYIQNRTLTSQRDSLISLSRRLKVDNPDELAMAALPEVAYDFQSWEVYIPNDRPYELRLGIGAISERDIPPIVDSIQLAAGQHRVTLRTQDSSKKQFRYIVYVDGNQVIDRRMQEDWMPDGWLSAGGMEWPSEPKLSPPPIQLAARRYEPNLGDETVDDVSNQADNDVIRPGYRLWIDLASRKYLPASPSLPTPNEPQ